MSCNRCFEPFGSGPYCANCGVHKHRIARKIRRSHPIGGKRGRNSGVTAKAKKKKGRN